MTRTPVTDVRGGVCGACGTPLMFGLCATHGLRVPLTLPLAYTNLPAPSRPRKEDGRTIVGRKRRGITATS